MRECCESVPQLVKENIWYSYKCPICGSTTCRSPTEEEARDMWDYGPVFGKHPLKESEEEEE
jgi:hypothetical protein